MSRKKVSTFLFFALLIIITCSAILPVFSLQNNISIASHGTINYSGLSSSIATPTPTPTPTTTPTPTPTPTPPSQYKGQIYLLFGKSLTQELIQKVIISKQSTGYPDYIDVGNWGVDRAHWTSPHFTEDKIIQLRNAKIKCICHIPTDWDWITEAQVRNMIDYQMSIGPSIDGFFFDCTPNFGNGGAEWGDVYYGYLRLRDYVHSLGKIVFVNPGTKNIGDDTCTSADFVCVEFDWIRFVNEKTALIQNYPTKFFAFSETTNPQVCVSDTIQAWNSGVYVFGPRVELTVNDSSWQQYLSQLLK